MTGKSPLALARARLVALVLVWSCLGAVAGGLMAWSAVHVPSESEMGSEFAVQPLQIQRRASVALNSGADAWILVQQLNDGAELAAPYAEYWCVFPASFDPQAGVATVLGAPVVSTQREGNATVYRSQRGRVDVLDPGASGSGEGRWVVVHALPPAGLWWKAAAGLVLGALLGWRLAASPQGTSQGRATRIIKASLRVVLILFLPLATLVAVGSFAQIATSAWGSSLAWQEFPWTLPLSEGMWVVLVIAVVASLLGSGHSAGLRT